MVKKLENGDILYTNMVGVDIKVIRKIEELIQESFKMKFVPYMLIFRFTINDVVFEYEKVFDFDFLKTRNEIRFYHCFGKEGDKDKLLDKELFFEPHFYY